MFLTFSQRGKVIAVNLELVRTIEAHPTQERRTIFTFGARELCTVDCDIQTVLKMAEDHDATRRQLDACVVRENGGFTGE